MPSNPMELMGGKPPELIGVCVKKLKVTGADGYLHLKHCDCDLPPWDAEINVGKNKGAMKAPAREMMDTALGELKK